MSCVLEGKAEQMSIIWHDAVPSSPTLSPNGDAGCRAAGKLEPMLTSPTLKQLLDTMGQAVFAVTRDGSLFLWNHAAEKLFGKPRASVIHKDIRHVLDPGDFLHILLSSLDHGIELTGVEVKTFCRQKPVTLLVDLRILRKKNLEPNGGLCVLTDLTPIREQEQRLRCYEQLSVTSKIIAGFAHEIRNPIAAIRGFTQLLLEGQTARDPSTYLNLILNEVDRVNDLIKGFISLAHGSDAGMKTVAPIQLVQDIVAVIQGYTFLNGIDLQTDLQATETTVQGDPDQLKQVFLNLVKNAVDFTPPGGEVHITTRQDGQTLSIEIRDTGRGIKASDLSKVFDIYFTTNGGTGLGLPISRNIIQQHGGSLTLDSREGSGTTVTVTLPVSTEADTVPKSNGIMVQKSTWISQTDPVQQTYADNRQDDTSQDHKPFCGSRRHCV